MGSYSSGPPAGGTPQILIFKTYRTIRNPALYVHGCSLWWRIKWEGGGEGAGFAKGRCVGSRYQKQHAKIRFHVDQMRQTWSELIGSLKLGNVLVLLSWFIGQRQPKSSCTKTQTLHNLRLPISSEHGSNSKAAIPRRISSRRNEVWAGSRNIPVATNEPSLGGGGANVRDGVVQSYPLNSHQQSKPFSHYPQQSGTTYLITNYAWPKYLITN